MVAIRCRVMIPGWIPSAMAAFSAGRPNESHPMGESTPKPCIVL